MENNEDVKFVNEKFIVCLEDGKNKVATPITRLKIEGTDTEYLYYSIDDEENNDKVFILASKIVTEEENGHVKESLKDLENEEERQIAYQLFSETYKILKGKNKSIA